MFTEPKIKDSEFSLIDRQTLNFTVLPCSWKVPGSNFSPDAEYPDAGILWPSSVYPSKLQDMTQG